jgi:hypothetical protein
VNPAVPALAAGRVLIGGGLPAKPSLTAAARGARARGYDIASWFAIAAMSSIPPSTT